MTPINVKEIDRRSQFHAPISLLNHFTIFQYEQSPYDSTHKYEIHLPTASTNNPTEAPTSRQFSKDSTGNSGNTLHIPLGHRPSLRRTHLQISLRLLPVISSGAENGSHWAPMAWASFEIASSSSIAKWALAILLVVLQTTPLLEMESFSIHVGIQKKVLSRSWLGRLDDTWYLMEIQSCWCLGVLVGVDPIILSEQRRMKIKDVNSESIAPISASTSPRRWNYVYSWEHVLDNTRDSILLPVVSWFYQLLFFLLILLQHCLKRVYLDFVI